VARTCVASLCDSAAFAKIVAQEAYARHFFAAARRAFLGDGQKYNWSMQQQWFKDFEPITDFIHPLSYLYPDGDGGGRGRGRAVAAVRVVDDGLLARAGCVGHGGVARLAEAAGSASSRTRAPGGRRARVAPADPRVSGEQRQPHGLPALPAAGAAGDDGDGGVLIREVNYRVKGTEKFWNHPQGAEAILQVRAAVLSDDGRPEQHLRYRPGSPYRYYRRRSQKREAGQPA
jgi:hypothetical protein